MSNFIKIFENIPLPAGEKWIIAAGVFDGVHPGHQAIISAARRRAALSGALVMALTFVPHPRQLLAKESSPELLVSVDERVKMLLDAGADSCGFIDFSAETAALTPDEFLAGLRDNGVFEVSGICVGEKWRFGAKGSGNKGVLDRFCRENNWSFDAVKELELDGVTISSTAIRQALAAGDIAYAARLWGREVEMSGVVEHGFQIAGSKLSAPTANLKSGSLLPLPFGVYSGKVPLDGKTYTAILNIGVAPTFGNGLRRVEIHLLDFEGSLYGRNITVKVRRFIRSERKFDSPEALKEQIFKDIADVRQNG
ncbi:MAG: riboflavin biosynthesis protein RibF [Lentisphaeria bacterium]|nr:riboflavin biosynthesis protein RibF [Lentisphaeria bacterium]